MEPLRKELLVQTRRRPEQPSLPWWMDGTTRAALHRRRSSNRPSGRTSLFLRSDWAIASMKTRSNRWIDSLPGDQGGLGEPSSVDVLLDSTSNGEFEALPTSVDENGIPGDITDDQLRASGGSQLGTFRLASDSQPTYRSK